MATQLLPLDSLEINPFNCRACYGEAEVTRLARSLATHGQLSPIKVRRSRTSGQRRYEVIYGHRRCLAAKRLGWTQIRAEVVSASDTESIEQSLVENLERQDLSDYEKGMVFRRLNNEFGKTYEEIGALVGGLSKQRISSYVAMTRLFSAEDLASNPELRSALFRIDEHHARILSTIGNREARIELAIRTAREHLSVREVSNIVFRLRSWFRESPPAFSGGKKAATAPMQMEGKSVQDEEKAEILRILSKTLNLDNEKKSDRFESFHLFNEGYSQFSYFPPMNLLEQSDARSRSLEWFEKVSASNKEILEQKIDIVGDVAVAALLVRNVGRENHAGQEWITRGTIVLVRKKGYDGYDENQGSRWRTLHEHWSLLNDEDDDTRVTTEGDDGGEKLETREESVELHIGSREVEPLARL